MMIRRWLRRPGRSLVRTALGLLAISQLLLFAACGESGTVLASNNAPTSSDTSAANASASGNTVTVTLSEFKVDSSVTKFSPGVPYHFVVTNHGVLPHELWVGPLNPQAAVGGAGAIGGIKADDLAPGATKSFDVTFPQSAATAKLELACHVAGHYEGGMHLPITVQ